jgi:hypothetical protein
MYMRVESHGTVRLTGEKRRIRRETYRGERFQVLTAASVKFRVFWDVAPCSHVEVDRRFRGAYCFHHQGDESSPLWNVGQLQRDYTVLNQMKLLSQWHCPPQIPHGLTRARTRTYEVRGRLVTALDMVRPVLRRCSHFICTSYVR